MSLDSSTLYHRQRQYREALGCAFDVPDVTFEFVASGGVCAPLGPVYALHTFTVSKIAEAYEVPLELLLPIPEELPGGP